jgi:molybdate transport system substrate-binding protein
VATPLAAPSLAATLALVATLALAGCTTGLLTPWSAPSSDAASDVPAGTLQGELTIFAAASLNDSFTELAEAFSAENPHVTVAPISFDGSSTLATQISEGAPVDVFASADEATMAKITAELAAPPTLFTSNELQIAVQPGNPLGITTLADLAQPGLQIALCAPEVPCGVASHQLLDRDGVALGPVTEEQNVKAVLTKVQLGEVDAGLVFVTDVLAAAGMVDGIRIVGAERARNSYPIAVLNTSSNPDVAQAFLRFVLSERGQTILAGHGFLPL